MSARSSKEDGPDAASAEAAGAATTGSGTDAAAPPASLGAGGAAALGAAGPGAPPSLGGAAPGEKKKTHPYRPPRLGDSFQAVVPAFGRGAETQARAKSSTGAPGKKGSAGRASAQSSSDDLNASSSSATTAAPGDLRPNQLSLREGLIWDPNALPADEVDDYLVFTRGLVEQTSHTRDRKAAKWLRAADGGNGQELIPLEADERALYYLYQQKYDVGQTSVRLISELGAKKEYKFLHALDTLYQSGASATALDRRDRSSLLGSYASGGTPAARTGGGNRPAQYPYPYSYPKADGAAALAAVPSAAVEEDGDEGAAPMEEDEEDEGAGLSSVSTAGDSRKKRVGADKTEAKKQHLVLLEKGRALAKAVDAARKALRAKSAPAAAAASGEGEAGASGDVGGGDSAPAPATAAARPSQEDIFAVVRDLAALPALELQPGDNATKDADRVVGQLKDVLAETRQYAARVHDALNTTAPGGASTVEELRALLEEVRGQPVQLREEAQLARFIEEANAWQAHAEAMVASLEQATVLEAQALIKATEAIPVHFELKGFLQERAGACIALGAEIRATIPVKSRGIQYQKLDTLQALLARARELRLRFHEVGVLAAVIERAEKWHTEAAAAVSETPDLKRLQGLLEEANSIPVDLSETCEVIQGKVRQAQEWVEKVRKALPRKNKTRSNAANDMGKVDYSAARTLLSEGAGIRVDVKELDDIAGVLDTAETWLQRVREALNDADADEASLESLQALLHEADDIPVEMDEHKILAAEIEARRWGLRVQPRLRSPNVTVLDLEALVAEAAELRSRLPIAAEEQKAWPLPQEAEAKRLLARAQGWLKAHRRCLNPNGLGFRRGVTVRRLLRLIGKARTVPVDLAAYTQPMVDGVEAAEKWLGESKPLLASCGVWVRSTFVVPTPAPTPEKNPPPGAADGDAMDVDGGEERAAAAATAAAVTGALGGAEEEEDPLEDEDEEEPAEPEGGRPGPTGPKVSQEQLTECVTAAQDLSAELPEAEEIKALHGRVLAWLEQLGVVCPKRLSKRRGGRQKVTVEQVRALVAEGEAMPVDLTEEVAEIQEKLAATLQWQAEVQGQLLTMAEEAQAESAAYTIRLKRKAAAEAEEGGEPTPEGEAAAAAAESVSVPGAAEGAKREAGAEEDEGVNEGLFGESYEKRLARLAGLGDHTTDAGIESAEDGMIRRHEQAHKWFVSAIDLLEFVDPEEPISDLGLAEIEDFVKKGEKLLYQEQPCAVGQQQDAPEQEDGAAAEPADGGQAPKQEEGAEAPTAEASEDAGAGADRRPATPAAAKGEGKGPTASPMDGNGSPAGSAGGEEGGEAGAPRRGKAAAAAEKVLIPPSGRGDEVLQATLLFWWEKTRRLREIWEASRDWSRRAARIVGPGGERVRMGVMEALLAETEAWDFRLEAAAKVKHEVLRARNIQARAHTALEGDEAAKLEMPALKSLIVEGDKCKVQIEDIKHLRRHLMNGQKWLARFEKARAEDLEEMMALVQEAAEVRANLGEEYARAVHRITRCCFCRQTVDGSLIRCGECGERYHQRCMDVGEQDAATWESKGWCCPRCLVRWHMKDALAKTMVLVSKWIAAPNATPLEPPAYAPPGISYEELYRTMESTTGKVKAWMKRLLHAVMACAERDAEEVRTLGSSKLVKSSVLVEVIRLAKADSQVDACADVKEVIWNLSVVFWGARLICQLRRRPSLLPLQALTAEMRSVGIHNEPLQVMLTLLIQRSLEWIQKTKPILRDGWVARDAAPVDVERLRALVQEKRNIPVRLQLERRVEAMLSEEQPGKRYCHCRGFYDGFFMVQCVACQEWFHGKCVQIRAEDLDRKTEYQCAACCEAQKIPYPYQPYRSPDPELALAEAEEDEDEATLTPAEEEEILMADKRSLEGVFPDEKKLASLDRASNHVDLSRLPLPPALKRKKSGEGAGGPGGAGGGSGGSGSGPGRKRSKPASAFAPSAAGVPTSLGGGRGSKGVKRKSPAALGASASGASLTASAGAGAGAGAGADAAVAGYPFSASLDAHQGGASVASMESGGGGERGGGSKRGRGRKLNKHKMDDFV